MAKEYIDREEKCGDCIHAEVCETAQTLTVQTITEFSRENHAYCQKFKNSANVAPVVRCNECKYYEIEEDVILENRVVGFCTYRPMHYAVGKNDFCSYGERKLKEDNKCSDT